MSCFNRNHFVFICIIFWPVTVFRASDGGSITWFEPPPFETVTDESSVAVANKSVVKGSVNEEVSCKFKLSADLRIVTVSMKFDGSNLVTFLPGQLAPPSVTPGLVNRFNTTWIPNQLTLILLNVTAAEEGEYLCEVISVGVSGQTWTRRIHVSLLVPPSITKISGKIVMEGENVTLNCPRNGKPTPSIKWTRLSDNHTVNMPLINISRHDAGDYRCTADNGVGTPATREASIDVQYKPDTVSLVTNTTENTNCSDLLWVNFTCEASDANPPVEGFQLLKEGEIVATSSYGTWIRGISEARDHVYSCNALHLLGNVTADNVIVSFNVPAQSVSVFVSGSEVLIEGGNLFLHCNADGLAYPKPTVTWSKLNADGSTKLSSWLNFTNIGRQEAGDYVCIANNTCGKTKSSRRTIDVQYPPEVNGSGKNATVAGGVEYTFSCPVDGNPVPNITWYSETGTRSGKQFKTRESGCYICGARNVHGVSGSVTQCLIINSSLPTVPPSTDPSQSMVSSITVSQNASQIMVSFSTASQSLSSSSTTAPKARLPWIIIIAVAGGVVILAILVAVLTWWVHKQRKCRKDAKIHNSGLGRHDDEGGYSQVQGAYAQSGPPAASGADGAIGQEVQVAAATPTYAVVDKSKKKKNKKLREEVPPVYAEVDKSKKKKKKVDDKNLYETLDEPKKARKPGELLYADLGDFQNPGMSPVSISPQPLPAIKIPEPYERTDYADITQFHKGNAKLPQNDGNEDTEMKPKRPSKKKIQGNDNETPI